MLSKNKFYPSLLNSLIILIFFLTSFSNIKIFHPHLMGPFFVEFIILLSFLLFSCLIVFTVDLTQVRNFFIIIFGSLYSIIICLVAIYKETTPTLLGLVFVYQYLPIILFASQSNLLISKRFLIVPLTTLSIFLIIIGIIQAMKIPIYDKNLIIQNFLLMLPDAVGGRAIGFSRSVIHYSTLIVFLNIFLFMFYENKIFRIFLLMPIFLIASMVSGSRGAFLGLIIFYLIINYKIFISFVKKHKIISIIFSIFFLIFISLVINKFGCGRVCNVSTFYTADYARIETFKKFFENLSITGMGIGHSSTALKYFGYENYLIGFESYLLNTIAHGGVYTLFLILAFTLIFFPLKKIESIASLMSLGFVGTVQQTYENPSMTCILWILLLYIKKFDSSDDIRNL